MDPCTTLPATGATITALAVIAAALVGAGLLARRLAGRSGAFVLVVTLGIAAVATIAPADPTAASTKCSPPTTSDPTTGTAITTGNSPASTTAVVAPTTTQVEPSTPTPTPDLTISAAAISAQRGELDSVVRFAIEVREVGGTATSGPFQFVVPGAAAWDIDTGVEQGWSFSASGSDGIWTYLPGLTAGQSVATNVRIYVPLELNSVTIDPFVPDGSGGDANSSNNSTTATSQIPEATTTTSSEPGEVDLTLSITALTAQPGTALNTTTWSLTVSEIKGASSTGPVIVDFPGTSTWALSHTGSGWVQTTVGTARRWTYTPALDAFGSSTVAITFLTPPEINPVTVSPVILAGSGGDANSANNSASASISVPPL